MSDTNCKSQNCGTIIAAVLLALGLMVTGYFISDGLVHLRGGERAVSVRGLSERDVKADLAIWPIQYTVTDNDLSVAQNQLQEQAKRSRRF